MTAPGREDYSKNVLEYFAASGCGNEAGKSSASAAFVERMTAICRAELAAVPAHCSSALQRYCESFAAGN